MFGLERGVLHHGIHDRDPTGQLNEFMDVRTSFALSVPSPMLSRKFKGGDRLVCSSYIEIYEPDVLADDMQPILRYGTSLLAK